MGSRGCSRRYERDSTWVIALVIADIRSRRYERFVDTPHLDQSEGRVCQKSDLIRLTCS